MQSQHGTECPALRPEADTAWSLTPAAATVARLCFVTGNQPSKRLSASTEVWLGLLVWVFCWRSWAAQPAVQGNCACAYGCAEIQCLLLPTLWPSCCPADARKLKVIGPLHPSSLTTVMSDGRPVEPTPQQSIGGLEEVFGVRSSSTMPGACSCNLCTLCCYTGWLACGWQLSLHVALGLPSPVIVVCCAVLCCDVCVTEWLVCACCCCPARAGEAHYDLQRASRAALLLPAAT